MTSPGHICSECPDGTRIERRCPFPLRDDSRARLDGEPVCKVLTVPAWFHDMAELGTLIADGGVSPADIDARTWELARQASAAIRDGRESAEERAKRKRQILAAALGGGAT